MNLQTFTADSMPAALAMVKAKLGSQAVILHTRTYRRGGVLGFGTREVVEVTAGSGPMVGHPARRSGAGGSRSAARGASAERVRRERTGIAAARTGAVSSSGIGRTIAASHGTHEQQAAGDLIRRTYKAAQAELQRRQASVGLPADVLAQSEPSSRGQLIREAAEVPPQPPHPPHPTQAAGLPHEQLASDLAEVKRMVARVMSQRAKPSAETLPDVLFDQYRALIEQEVTEELADQTITAVRARLSDDQLADPAAVRQAVRQELIALIPGGGQAEAETKPAGPPADGRPRTIALIGPTGVGKTTTIAKLAAQFKLREKKRVGMVTLDTYRIAAVEQLRTYASIIGVPLKVAVDPASLKKVLAGLSDCDVILIDTAGRSQRDGERLEQLQTLLSAADPHEVHLVLSSTCTQTVMAQAIDRFSKVRADKIILTKLDEAVSFGVVLNVARQVDKQFSYVTTGQEVPHDIEATRADRLVDLVLGEGLKT